MMQPAGGCGRSHPCRRGTTAAASAPSRSVPATSAGSGRAARAQGSSAAGPPSAGFPGGQWGRAGPQCGEGGSGAPQAPPCWAHMWSLRDLFFEFVPRSGAIPAQRPSRVRSLRSPSGWRADRHAGRQQQQPSDGPTVAPHPPSRIAAFSVRSKCCMAAGRGGLACRGWEAAVPASRGRRKQAWWPLRTIRTHPRARLTSSTHGLWNGTFPHLEHTPAGMIAWRREVQ